MTTRAIAAWLARHAFRLKLMAAAALGVLASVALVTALNLRGTDQRLSHQIELHIQQTTPLLNAALAAPLARHEHAVIQDILENSRVAHGIEYLVVTDPSGFVIAQAGWDPRRPLPEPDPLFSMDTAATHIDRRVPLMVDARELGHLHFGVSVAPLREARREAVVNAFTSAAVGTGAALVLLAPLGVWLTRNLSHLSAAARRLAAGELKARALAEADDEIGEVAAAFNRMADALEARMREVKASEERLALVLSGTTDGIWDWDLVHNQVHFSQRFREMLGYEDETEFRAAFFFPSALHPEDRERVMRAQNEHLLHRVPFDEEYRLRGKDGHFRWVRGRGQATWDASGKASRYAGSMTDLSRQKAAEAALRESEQRLYYAVRGSSDGIWDWDRAEGKYYISPRFKALLGYADDELANDRASFLEALHPDDRPRVEAEVRRHFADRGAYDIEYRLRHKDGSYRWFRGRGQAVWNEAGEVVRFSGASSDIMERKQADERLRALLAEQAAILGNAVVGITVVKERRIAHCNRRFEELLGYAPGELTGRSTECVYPSHESFEAAGRLMYQSLAQGLPYAGEWQLRRKDGSLLWCHVTGRAVEPRRVQEASIWIFSDMSEQRAALEAVRAEKEFSDALINALPGVFYLYDDAGTMLRWNANLERLLGYGAEEVARMKALDFIAPAQRKSVAQAIDRALRAGESSGETEGLTRDGRIVPYFLTAVRLVIDGRVLLAGVGMDITDRKRAEAEVRSLNERLEQGVRERTAELEAANRELEAFSYSVSHDLTAPLRSIDGFSRMLEEDYGDRLGAEAHHYIERIRAGTQRMQRLIDDLLSLSRVTRGDMHRQSVDLSHMAHQACAELMQAHRRPVTVRIAEGLSAYGDPNLLAIALGNLLGNAWKFTARHPSACVEVGSLERDGSSVYFVRDDGAGFDMRYAARLFEPFQRMHGVQEFDGTGIGLAIVKRIVQRHGGRIWAEAEVEKGATFYFTLA